MIFLLPAAYLSEQGDIALVVNLNQSPHFPALLPVPRTKRYICIHIKGDYILIDQKRVVVIFSGQYLILKKL